MRRELRRDAPPRSAWTWRRILVVVALVGAVVGLVVLAITSVVIVHRALVAKDALQSAQQRLMAMESSVSAGGTIRSADFARVRAETVVAERATSGRVWAAYEHLPGFAPNLKALRQTAELVNGLARDGGGPVVQAADGRGLASLAPRNGAVDLQPIRRLVPAVAALDSALRIADGQAAAIDTRGVLPPLADSVRELRTTITAARPVASQLHRVMPILYPALGGDGARHYLLLFQNNAEERASGGNPASMAMLVVDHGKASLAAQANSREFPHPYAEPVRTYGGDWDELYGQHVTRYVTNITFTPDFPTTAELARTMWRGRFGGKVDGVISIDPVALAALLNVTGPVRLANGVQLEPGTAVQYLLYDVYAQNPDPAVQDAIFASAAQRVFDALAAGRGDPKAYLTQLGPIVDQQRLKLWSVRKDEQAVLIDSPLGTMLPADNTGTTVFGVYNNDDSTSKMSTFMDERVHVTTRTCAATPSATVTATVVNTLKAGDVAGLPPYVRAAQKHIPPGGDRQWVQLYGPVGARLVSATIDGERVVWGTSVDRLDNTNPKATGTDVGRPAVHGTIYGRPLAIVSVTTTPGESVDVAATFSGGTDLSRAVAVSHTPKVHDVPVTIDRAVCG